MVVLDTPLKPSPTSFLQHIFYSSQKLSSSLLSASLQTGNSSTPTPSQLTTHTEVKCVSVYSYIMIARILLLNFSPHHRMSYPARYQTYLFTVCTFHLHFQMMKLSQFLNNYLYKLTLPKRIQSFVVISMYAIQLSLVTHELPKEAQPSIIGWLKMVYIAGTQSWPLVYPLITPTLELINVHVYLSIVSLITFLAQMAYWTLPLLFMKISHLNRTTVRSLFVA